MLLPADVDHSTVFVKLLKKLRPSYDWVPAEAAAIDSTQQQQQSAEQQQQDEQQQQPQGHWQARALSAATLKELKLTRPEKEVSSRAGNSLIFVCSLCCVIMCFQGTAARPCLCSGWLPDDLTATRTAVALAASSRCFVLQGRCCAKRLFKVHLSAKPCPNTLAATLAQLTCTCLCTLPPSAGLHAPASPATPRANVQ